MTATAALCALSLVVSGCSLGTSRPPANPAPGVALSCTDGYGAPIVDAAVGAGFVAYGIYLASGSDCPERGGGEPCDAYAGHMSRGFGGLLTAAGVVVGLVSLVGFSRVSACRSAKARATPVH